MSAGSHPLLPNCNFKYTHGSLALPRSANTNMTRSRSRGRSSVASRMDLVQAGHWQSARTSFSRWHCATIQDVYQSNSKAQSSSNLGLPFRLLESTAVGSHHIPVTFGDVTDVSSFVLVIDPGVNPIVIRTRRLRTSSSEYFRSWSLDKFLAHHRPPQKAFSQSTLMLCFYICCVLLFQYSIAAPPRPLRLPDPDHPDFDGRFTRTQSGNPIPRGQRQEPVHDPSRRLPRPDPSQSSHSGLLIPAFRPGPDNHPNLSHSPNPDPSQSSHPRLLIPAIRPGPDDHPNLSHSPNPGPLIPPLAHGCRQSSLPHWLADSSQPAHYCPIIPMPGNGQESNFSAEIPTQKCQLCPFWYRKAGIGSASALRRHMLDAKHIRKEKPDEPHDEDTSGK